MNEFNEYQAEKEGPKNLIYSLVKLGEKRKPEEDDTIIKYLRKHSRIFAKFDLGFLRQFVRKIQVSEHKANDVIIKEDAEDNCLLMVLDGTVAKMKGSRLLERYRRHAILGEDVIFKPIESYRYRNSAIVAETDCKVLIVTKNKYQISMSFY